MCGIAGVFGRCADRAPVQRMLSAVSHRGPDDSGITSLCGPDGARAGCFAHARLAILDPTSRGRQPMVTADGALTLVFNGEIYNYRELRRELQRDGVTFGSDTDTEVLLLGWRRDGPEFARRLRGMYAFAIWDANAGLGYLARDAFGIKPLYYAAVEDGVAFASETRALLASGLIPPQLDRGAMASYLATGAVEEPSTILCGVRALEPGVVVEVRAGAAGMELSKPVVRIDPWREPEEELQRDSARAAARVLDALRDSVAAHLVSDVDLGIFLSGGIDSSALVALAAEAGLSPLRTFSVAFEEAGYDESGAAAIVARRFGTVHEEIRLSGGDLRRGLGGALSAMDQPTLDGINTYVLAGAVRRAGMKVALSGLGGDELFAGYPSFRRARRMRGLWRLPRTLRHRAAQAVGGPGGRRAQKAALMLKGSDPALAAYRCSRLVVEDATVRALCGRPPLRPERSAPGELTLLQRVSWYELDGYTRDMLLRDSDVFSMAHGLELRVPFLDPVVLSATLAADDATKLAGRGSKPLLVQALGQLLPRAVLDRPKTGFVVPLERWMRGDLRSEIEEAFSPAHLERVGVIPAAAMRVWNEYLSGERPWGGAWALYALVRWAEANDASVYGAEAPAALAEK